MLVNMPWQRNLIDMRKEFVTKALAEGANVSAVCREYGISRKTGYKWMKRYEESGTDGLADQSKRPHRYGLATSVEITCELIALKDEHPTWGPKKIRKLLMGCEKYTPEEIPCVRTVHRILERSGRVKKRSPRKRLTQSSAAPSVSVESSNDLWTVDFKGWWKTRNGSRCEPLTVRDAYSRFVLCTEVLGGTGGAAVHEIFQQLFETYGIPGAILSDNGSPFACTAAILGLSQLSAWWMSLGIEVLRSRPGCPQDNGAHERMHRDMKLEVQARKALSTTEQQAACDIWRKEFNEVRPHESLNMETPASVYTPGNNSETRVVPTVPTDCETRTVDKNGRFRFYGESLFLSRALSGHLVGLRPVDEEQYEIWFYNKHLANYCPTQLPVIQPVNHDANHKENDDNTKADKKENQTSNEPMNQAA